MTSAKAIRLVWWRYFDVFRKNVGYSVVTTFVEPLLYLASFGFGVGALVPALQLDGISVTYRQFVLAGIVAQTVLFQAFFEAAYGGFVRMYYQRIFQAIAVTPITLSEVLWGELLWNTCKSGFAAAVVVLIGCTIGDFHWRGALFILPVIILGALVFASMGLLVAARSRSIDNISFPQFLLVFPMFLFCGVFFPLEQLPSTIQSLVWVLPLTPLVSLIRSLMLGLPLFWPAWLILILWAAVLVPIARRAMRARLVK
ncbi:MAG TPA: ABC transporter permease [Candidatus Ozemobacteraceae bacterium]|nr:ABC transporter permease [Candidatus Ozemobacteraceae bacterium]